MNIKLLVVGVVVALCAPFAMAQLPGSIDVTYGTNGKATASNGQEYSVAWGMALQKDGKTIVAGTTLTDIMLTRFTTQGMPDSTFGDDGVVVTDINNNSVEQPNAVIVQADGKILVTGITFTNSKRNFALLRYLPNGTLDNSFSNDGKVITVLSIGQDEPRAIALQPDGKILLAGYSDALFAVVRYKQNGTLDSTFSNDGIQTTAIDTGNGLATSVHVLKDGKILLVGYHNYNAQTDCAMAQYKANGQLDSSFGTNGKVIADIGGIDRIYCATVQPDDKIVVAGNIYTSDYAFGIARFTKTGILDTAFSSDGKLSVSYGNSHSSKALGVAVQPDGKILVAGTDSYSGSDIALLRLDSKGVPDATFGTAGKVLTNFGTVNIDEGVGIAVLPTGKIMVGGNSDGNFIAVRYHSGLNLGLKNVRINNSAVLYPNPVNDNASLEFSLAEASSVSITVTDMQGRVIYTLPDNAVYNSGKHTVSITLPSTLAAGSYCLLLTAAQQQQVVRMLKY
ncbi:MAG: T9SS type A sorting domain-containing protein [Bacteroidota bacterium]